MLFCREFGNVVNQAFLVLIFWAKTAADATFFAFCKYDGNSREQEFPSLFTRQLGPGAQLSRAQLYAQKNRQLGPDKWAEVSRAQSSA